MRTKHLLFIFLINSIISVSFRAFPVDPETVRIMPFVADRKPCGRCHLFEKHQRIAGHLEVCDIYCVTCHSDTKEKHHPVGDIITSSVPDSILLTQKKKLSCTSCHNLFLNRYDSKPWKAQSLFRDIFDFSKSYKTYYLVERNNDGQLCRICH